MSQDRTTNGIILDHCLKAVKEPRMSHDEPIVVDQAGTVVPPAPRGYHRDFALESKEVFARREDCTINLPSVFPPIRIFDEVSTLTDQQVLEVQKLIERRRREPHPFLVLPLTFGLQVHEMDCWDYGPIAIRPPVIAVSRVLPPSEAWTRAEMRRTNAEHTFHRGKEAGDVTPQSFESEGVAQALCVVAGPGQVDAPPGWGKRAPAALAADRTDR